MQFEKIQFNYCAACIFFQDSGKGEIFINWELGTAGKSAKGEDKAMCDFAIRLKTLVEARELTGFYCEVKREMDGVSRYI